MTAGAKLERAPLVAMKAREAERFVAERPRSRELWRKGRAVMPSGVPMAWMAGLYDHPPLFAAAGEGAYFTDVDGHRYLDMNQADVSTSCGFTPAPVIAAVRERMALGSQFLLPGEDAIEVAGALAARFGLPRWQFTLSASGANAEAIRLARTATGRDMILLFDGKYHGHIEETLVGLVDGVPVPEMLGLTDDASARCRLVAYNDLAAAEAALEDQRVACVLVEPALTNIGVVLPEAGFLTGLRRLTQASGTLLLLDETHTQACAYGGLTGAWSLSADLVVLGKSLGGGVPIGTYGMTENLAQVMEQSLDRDGAAPESVGGIATGGTLFANALSMAAARAALEQVLTRAGFELTAALGERLAGGIQGALDRRGLPWRAQRLFCRSGFSLASKLPHDAETARRATDFELNAALRLYLANRGVWEAVSTAGPSASFAMTEADIDLYLELFEGFLAEITP